SWVIPNMTCPAASISAPRQWPSARDGRRGLSSKAPSPTCFSWTSLIPSRCSTSYARSLERAGTRRKLLLWCGRCRGGCRLGRDVTAVVVGLDHAVGQIVLPLHERNRLLVDDHGVPVSLGEALYHLHGLLQNGGHELVLLALQLTVVLHEHLLNRLCLDLPLFSASCQRLGLHHPALLLQLLALPLQVVLLLVELALTVVEQFLERRLHAQAVFGLRDRALRVEHRDPHLSQGQGCQKRQSKRY